jgi:hypothetical protein
MEATGWSRPRRVQLRRQLDAAHLASATCMFTYAWSMRLACGRHASECSCEALAGGFGRVLHLM